MNPEQQARAEIDRLLQPGRLGRAVGRGVNLHAAPGVAIREFPLNPGHGFADYLLYVDGKACGVIEAKKQGATLTGVEVQSTRYAQGFPPACPPGSGRCPSCTSPPASKPISPRVLIRSLALATCLLSTSRRCWRSG